MAVRVRQDGRVLCAARHPAEPGDAYLDDGTHYELSVERRVLVTEPMAKHAEHGQWWWKGQEPAGVVIDPFYYEEQSSGRDASAADVDGAESPSGPRGRHESVGERQGRQPAPNSGRLNPGRPFCECGSCDATARNGGREVLLPPEAWAVAGAGDPERIAVTPGHGRAVVAQIRADGGTCTVEKHRGWWAVG